jgi:hypothetical protein
MVNQHNKIVPREASRRIIEVIKVVVAKKDIVNRNKEKWLWCQL